MGTGHIGIILLVISVTLFSIIPSSYADSFEVDAGSNGTFDIEYSSLGVEISKITADVVEIEIILQVQVTSSSNFLIITFDRDSFDAKFGEEDDIFITLADGKWLNVEEIETTSQSRTLRLELPQAANQLEIFGTKIMDQTLGGPEVIEEPETETEFPLTVSTDKSSYKAGDTIVITGTIKTLNQNYSVDVTVIVVSPVGDIVSIDLITPNSDGTYSTSFIADGPLWKTGGEYTVKAQ